MRKHLQTNGEILVVGNELLNGTTLDTNSHWLSKQLVKIGLKVERKTTVRDELGVISNTFDECFSREPDWIFSLGGLGPTYDDMTIQALGIALNKKLVLDKNAVKMLEQSRKRRAQFLNRPAGRIPKTSLKMAKIPESSLPLFNSVGSAPGVLAESRRTKIVSLPGVPSEMKAIFRKEVAPLLQKDLKEFVNAEEWLEVVGASESRLSPDILKISKKYSPIVYIKSHPLGFRNGKSLIHIQIILTAPSGQKESSLDTLQKAASEMATATRKLGGKSKRIKSVR